MINKIKTLKIQTLLVWFVLFSQNLKAQDIPFDCDNNAYLFQFNDIYSIDLATGNSFEVATDVTEGNINATAYNPADGFIWGSVSEPAKTIVRIDKDFKTSTFYINELPIGNRYIGGINSDGIYCLKSGGKSYDKIDLNPNSTNYGKHVASLKLSRSISIHDWAFNPVDNQLYAVEKTTNILYRINADTGNIVRLGEVPILSGLSYTYGAVYFDDTGRFYVSANQTGTIYVIHNVQDLNGYQGINSNVFAFGPSASSNDGARCPTAPVLQEDCSNGIDDDGDGLIDCEDPSCSSYDGCNEKALATSSANKGGLESNNRLSEKINKRNFKRAKNNYKFDYSSAKKFSKPPLYGKKSIKSSIQLTDFIPLEIINEDEVIESSPLDLSKITNAKEIYSVDYIKNGLSSASILIIRTEDGVYEHTKYICDRLFGAELISVSTIEINEQKFIKSIIRNVEGSLEFVLSLSSKVINNSFEIESHWNLDKYEKHVAFYNFQIWSNSLDDLLLLGEEVVRLLEVQKPIKSYKNSLPPTVFVRKGKYINGKLELQIVNTNKTKSITFDSGLRETETSNVEYVASSLELETDYISNYKIESGNLFDIGFRIGDGTEIPDDLFMSDGPWGYDDAAPSTTVNSYFIQPNNEIYEDDEFPIERSLELTATTNEYVAAYRSLLPEFYPVNLTKYKSFQLKARGTGTLIIRLVKKSIGSWKSQYKASITLTNNMEEYSIPFSEFRSISEKPLELNDITTVVFTLQSETGELETKEMSLYQLRFSPSDEKIHPYIKGENGFDQLLAVPNPMKSETTLHITCQKSETIGLLVYNQIGALVRQTSFKAKKGKNEIYLYRENLKSGLYFCKINSEHSQHKAIKLLID